jgi:hypothetical protein
VTLVLATALAVFAHVSVSIPGLEADIVDFGRLTLLPALGWLIAAAILVELTALTFPAGRALRQTSDGRRRLRLFALVLAQLLLVQQALFNPVTPQLAAAPQLALILTRCVGLPLLLGLAAANHRWGLGEGISIAAGALLLEPLINDARTAEAPTQALIILVVTIAVAVWLAHPARPAALGRTPLTRDDPHPRDLGLGLTIPSGGVIALELLALASLVPSREINNTLELALVLTLTAALAFAFTRPKLLIKHWRRAFPLANPAALAHDAQAIFRRALLRTELLLLAAVLLTQALIPALTTIILAAIALDLRAELRLRLHEPNLVALPTHLDVPGAQALALALDLQAKPAALRAQHHRSLYHLFGWWLPTHILIRPADLDTATQLRDQLLEQADPPPA